MTYRDPGSPLPADQPTEAVRVTPDAAAEPPPTGGPSEGAPATATQPVRTPGPRRGLRWAVALVVTALVVTSVAAAVFMMSGKAPDAKVIGWVPADSVIYGEARLDLPGDQRAKLAEFLAKFPGFRDQAALEAKITEVLDRLVSGASDGAQSYSGDLAPWFGGELAFSMGDLPAGTDFSDPTSFEDVPRFTILVSITDRVAAQAWFADALKDASTTTEDYNGTQLTLVTGPGASAAGEAVAYAIVADDVLVAGQVDAVKAAIDTKGDGGLAADASFAAALASSSDDHVGLMYMDLRRYAEWAMSLSGDSGFGGCGTTLSTEMRDMVPDWVVMRLRIEGDALVMDGVSPMPDGLEDVPVSRASTLAARMPASTIVFVEGHDVGERVLDAIDIYRSDPACADALREVDTAVGLLGGLDNMLGWMGDTAMVVNRTDDGVEGGLVFHTEDATSARNLVLTLRSFVALGGAQAGLSIRDENHGEDTITILDLGDASSLLGMAGMAGGMDIEPPGGPDARVELAWTVTDDLVVVSVGPGFVRRVLDTDAAGSLASDSRFNSLLGRTGAENVGVTYADVAALRELIEDAGRSDPAAFATYQEEVQPFLLPFDAFMMSSLSDAEEGGVKAVITIR